MREMREELRRIVRRLPARVRWRLAILWFFGIGVCRRAMAAGAAGPERHALHNGKLAVY